MGAHCIDDTTFGGRLIIKTGSLGFSRNSIYGWDQFILDNSSCDKFGDRNGGIVDVNSSLSKIYNSNLIGGLKVGYSRMKMSDSTPAFIVFDGSGSEYPTGEIYWSDVKELDEDGKEVAGPITMENTHIAEMSRTTCGTFDAKGSRIYGHNVVTEAVTLDDSSYIMDGSSAVGNMNITNSLFQSHYFSTQNVILKDESIAKINHFHPIDVTVSNKSVFDVVFGNLDNSKTLEKGKLIIDNSSFYGSQVNTGDVTITKSSIFDVDNFVVTGDLNIKWSYGTLDKFKFNNLVINTSNVRGSRGGDSNSNTTISNSDCLFYGFMNQNCSVDNGRLSVYSPSGITIPYGETAPWENVSGGLGYSLTVRISDIKLHGSYLNGPASLSSSRIETFRASFGSGLGGLKLVSSSSTFYHSTVPKIDCGLDVTMDAYNSSLAGHIDSTTFPDSIKVGIAHLYNSSGAENAGIRFREFGGESWGTGLTYYSTYYVYDYITVHTGRQNIHIHSALNLDLFALEDITIYNGILDEASVWPASVDGNILITSARAVVINAYEHLHMWADGIISLDTPGYITEWGTRGIDFYACGEIDFAQGDSHVNLYYDKPVFGRCREGYNVLTDWTSDKVSCACLVNCWYGG